MEEEEKEEKNEDDEEGEDDDDNEEDDDDSDDSGNGAMTIRRTRTMTKIRMRAKWKETPLWSREERHVKLVELLRIWAWRGGMELNWVVHR